MTPDPVAALLLDESGVSTGSTTGGSPVESGVSTGSTTGSVLTIDDVGGALTSALLAAGLQVSAYCDDLRDERDLPIAGLDSLDETTLAGVDLVLLRLPKSLGLLEDYAQRVAAFAAPGVRLLAGGREKHLTRGMNDVLAGSFDSVRASLGRQKSRVLHAGDARPGTLGWPRTIRLDDPALTVVSHAGVFAAGKLDGGTRLLLSALESVVEPVETPRRAVDLGCGTGILAAWLARAGYDVLALDASRAATASARDTAAANNLTLEVRRADGLAGHPSGSVDLVVCNPPFHRGTTKDSTPGFDLLQGAVPALSERAEVWTVFNSHLPYLHFLADTVGPTRVVARDRHYTVTRSRVGARR